ncbi:MAG: M48 family peptidase, partial [Sphingobacteriales bacterium]
MKKLLLFVSTVTLSVSLYSCFSNPITGRRGLNLVDETEMRTAANQQYRSFLSQNSPQKGTRDAEMVRRV